MAPPTGRVAGIAIRVDPPLQPQRRVQINEGAPPNKRQSKSGKPRGDKKDLGRAPPHSVTVGGRLCQFVEGWKRMTNDPYVLSVVAKGQTSFYESSPSASDSLGITISRRVTEDSGNARANFPNALEERNLRNISRHSSVLLERIPDTQGVWRVAPSYRLKTTEPPHRHSSLSHAHHKFSAKYCRKRRLHIQNRSAGCVLSCTNISGQQEVPTFCLRKQGRSVPSTSLRSEHCPSGIYLPGTYSASLPPSSGDIGNPESRRLANTSSRPSSVITPSVSVIAHTEHGRPNVKRSEI